MPKKKPSKFVLSLVFITMMTISLGMMYGYDMPMLFTDQLIIKFEITTLEISYMYTVLSIPNFIAAPLGGVILAYTGIGTGATILNGLIVISFILLFFGILWTNFPLVLLSRFVLGIGAELVVVAQTVVAEQWFTGSILSIALGACNILIYLTASLNEYTSPTLFIKYRNMETPIFVGACFTFFIFLMSAVYLLIETYYEPSTNKAQKQIEEWMSKERECSSELQLSFEGDEDAFEHAKDPENDPKFGLKDLKHLDMIFWMLVVLFSILSMCYYQFVNFITDFLMITFGYKYQEAKDLVFMRPIIAALFMPFFSVYTVYYGKKSLILILSSLTSLIGFSIFYYLPDHKSEWVFVGIIFLALMLASYSAAIWSSFTLVVPKEATGLAIAIALAIQNIFLTILPILFGRINEPRTQEAFNYSLVLLIGFSVFSLILSIQIFIYDYYFGDKILHLSENDDIVLEARANKSREWRNYVLKEKIDNILEGKGTQNILSSSSDGDL